MLRDASDTRVEVAVKGAEPIREGACRVIAEAGANHNNSVETAIEMARRAAEAGAWGVKYQLYRAETISVPESPKYWKDEIGTVSQYEAFKKSDHLDYAAYGDVAAACRELGIVFFATPFDLDAVDALENMDAPIYKIASGDITYRPLIEAVAATGKPVLLSTGAATREEVHNAIEWSGLEPDRLVLLVCTLAYPTPDEDGHFARIPTFAETFSPYLIGMSDHTLGPAGAWMTAALGGVCIEKHYTLDKTLPDIPDHRISVEPPELEEMVEACRRAATLRGENWIGVRSAEEPARVGARRSIVLERPVARGQRIADQDIGYKRPGTGLSPARLNEVVGRTARRELARGRVLSDDDLD
jgi:N,N'-diacetyllegionaminate synthase